MKKFFNLSYFQNITSLFPKRERISGLFIKLSVTIVFLTMSFCEKEPEDVGPITPYADLEEYIRGEYDSYAVFYWPQYAELLTRLSQEKFTVLPINEMRDTFDETKVVVGLRHDVDFNPFKALEMAKIEKSYGIRSTYYILATAEYYGNIVTSRMFRSHGIGYLLKELYDTGAEIGIHNDLLVVMMKYKLDPVIFNRDEIKYYKSLGIPVYGSAAHGTPRYKIPIPNYQIFSDFAETDSLLYEGKMYPLGLLSMAEFGYSYEAYHVNYGIYISDSGGKWNDPDGFEGIMRKLEFSKPGDRIQILVHPDWWGKQ